MDVPDWLVVVGAICTAVLAIIGVWKALAPVRARIGEFVDRLDRANQVVLGTPAIPDPDRPGEVLRAEIPDMGVRVTRVEELVQKGMLDAAQDSRESAHAAAIAAKEAAASAASAERIALGIASSFEDLSKRVDQWQNVDRVKAETATSVLHEIGMTLPVPAPQPREEEASA